MFLADAQKLSARCFRRGSERGGCVAVYVVTQGNRSPTFQRSYFSMVVASAKSLRRFLPEVRIMLLLMAGMAAQVPRELSALVNETRTLELSPAANKMVCLYQVGGQLTCHVRRMRMPWNALPLSGLGRKATDACAHPVRQGCLLRC